MWLLSSRNLGGRATKKNLFWGFPYHSYCDSQYESVDPDPISEKPTYPDPTSWKMRIRIMVAQNATPPFQWLISFNLRQTSFLKLLTLRNHQIYKYCIYHSNNIEIILIIPLFSAAGYGYEFLLRSRIRIILKNCTKIRIQWPEDKKDLPAAPRDWTCPAWGWRTCRAGRTPQSACSRPSGSCPMQWSRSCLQHLPKIDNYKYTNKRKIVHKKQRVYKQDITKNMSSILYWLRMFLCYFFPKK